MPLYLAGPLTHKELDQELRRHHLASGMFIVINTGLGWCQHVRGYRYRDQWIRYIVGFVYWLVLGRPKTAKRVEAIIDHAESNRRQDASIARKGKYGRLRERP